jgi:hypothetical protein
MPIPSRRGPFAGKKDGEGQNRTGDTTIFSGGSRSVRRARAELSGENVPANRRYRRLRSVSRYAGLVRARGRQVDVARNAPRQHRSAEANEKMRQRWWVTSGDSITRTKWSSTFGKPASRSSPPRRWRAKPPRSRKPLRAARSAEGSNPSPSATRTIPRPCPPSWPARCSPTRSRCRWPGTRRTRAASGRRCRSPAPPTRAVAGGLRGVGPQVRAPG